MAPAADPLLWLLPSLLPAVLSVLPVLWAWLWDSRGPLHATTRPFVLCIPCTLCAIIPG